nr:FkbM family methyltransferase [Tepidimonas sediminis]
MLSVIVTTYRRHRHLIRALVSVLIQKINPDDARFEVIVANDDPDDQMIDQIAQIVSGEVAYQGSLRVINRRTEDVGGVAASRNRAIEAARGDFLLFLDDDDFLVSGALASFVSLLKEHACDFVYANHVHVIEDADLNEITRIRRVQQDISYNDLLVMNRIPVGSFVIARRVIRHFFDEKYTSLEDWVFLLDNLQGVRLVRGDFDAVTICHSVDKGYRHRNREGGVSRFVENVCRLYIRHPSVEVLEARREVLASVELPSVAQLFIAGAVSAQREVVPRVVSTKQGRFLIVNEDETIQHSLVSRGFFEPLPALLAILIARQSQGLIIDVGANVGSFAVPVGLSIGGERLVAIEPQRQVFAMLEANLVINGILGVRSHRVVVDQATRETSTLRVPIFDVRCENYTGAVSFDPEVIAVRSELPGVAESSQRAQRYEDVAVRGLDQLLPGENINFIKIDVEGMEQDVIRSGFGLIQRERPFIYYEACPIERLQYRSHAVAEMLRGLGYRLFPVGGNFFACHPQRLAPSLRDAIGLLFDLDSRALEHERELSIDHGLAAELLARFCEAGAPVTSIVDEGGGSSTKCNSGITEGSCWRG